MDFIIDLLELEGYMNIVIVIDRLSKRVIINKLNDLEANIITKWFI
jgi:hypothetical protein